MAGALSGELKHAMKLKLLSIAAVATSLATGQAFAADAKSNWSKHCAKCHAENGSGQTATGRKLSIRDYRDPKVQTELKDRDMIKATRGGLKDTKRELMKPFGGVLSDDEIRELVAHIRSLEKK